MKKRKLTPRQREFVKLHRKWGGDLAKVAKEGNYSLQSISKFMSMPLVKNEIASNLMYCRERISAVLPQILDNLVEMQASDSVPFNVRATIGLQLLDRGGLTEPKAPQVQVNINTSISDRAREILAQRVQDNQVPTIDTTAIIEDDTAKA